MQHYTDLHEFLTHIGAEHLYRSSRKSYIRDNHPEIYRDIFSSTSAIIDAKFNERLYCYVHKITQRPTCKMCQNLVTYSSLAKVNYHTYCGRKCSIRDMPALIGVENTSQLPAVKEKKRISARKKYGVDNVAQAAEVRASISTGVSGAWASRFNDLVEDTDIDLNTMTKKEYNKLVWRITNWMYTTHIDMLDPLRLRGKDYQLDHKVSRCFGFYNKIPPSILGDVTNLELLPTADNSRKNLANSITVNELYHLYNVFYSTNALVPCDIIYSRQPTTVKSVFSTHAIGLCKYCKCIASYVHGAGRSQRWCCSASANSCPTNRTKNSKNQKTSSKKKANNNTGKHTYNNGSINVIRTTCPEGFVPGRLSLTRNK